MKDLTIGQLFDEVEATIRAEATEWSDGSATLDILLLNHRKFSLLLMEKCTGRELSEYMALDDISLGYMTLDDISDDYQEFSDINRLHGRAIRSTLKQIADDAHDAKSQQH